MMLSAAFSESHIKNDIWFQSEDDDSKNQGGTDIASEYERDPASHSDRDSDSDSDGDGASDSAAESDGSASESESESRSGSESQCSNASGFFVHGKTACIRPKTAERCTNLRRKTHGKCPKNSLVHSDIAKPNTDECPSPTCEQVDKQVPAPAPNFCNVQPQTPSDSFLATQPPLPCLFPDVFETLIHVDETLIPYGGPPDAAAIHIGVGVLPARSFAAARETKVETKAEKRKRRLPEKTKDRNVAQNKKRDERAHDVHALIRWCVDCVVRNRESLSFFLSFESKSDSFVFF